MRKVLALMSLSLISINALAADVTYTFTEGSARECSPSVQVGIDFENETLSLDKSIQGELGSFLASKSCSVDESGDEHEKYCNWATFDSGKKLVVLYHSTQGLVYGIIPGKTYTTSVSMQFGEDLKTITVAAPNNPFGPSDASCVYTSK